MSWNMSARATALAVAIAVLLLGGTTAFVAFAPEDGGPTFGRSGGAGLPGGFDEVPADVFVERVFGAQRAEESWHMEQQKTVNGTPGTLIRLDTEGGGERTQASIQISRPDGSTAPLQVIAIEGVYYAKGLNSERPWWRADPADGQVQATAAQTFADLLAVDTSEDLGDAVTDVELLGPDSVEGVTTAHYRLDLTQPVAAPPGATPSAMPDGQPEATLEVWVDAGDRPIRLVLTSVVEDAEVTVTTTFSRYGAEFAISAPPARQVTSAIPPDEPA